MIELQHITKRFGAVTALRDVSLRLEPGERLALVGENGAGKSSLMNVLYGLYRPDSGEVCFDGVAARLKSPTDALARGVGMVHQHFTLVPTLSVAENVVLGHEPTRFGALDVSRARAEVAATCAKLNFAVDPAARVSDLSVGSQQKVEIIKALHRGVKTLILDEPTAVLTPQEADELFAVARTLSEQGLAVVLISHKLSEVLAFSTRVVVMRRGEVVAETTPANTSKNALAELMVGEARAPAQRTGALAPGPVLLSLADAQAEGVRGVSLELRAGEVVGVAGVDGNGQRELAEVLTGLRPLHSGRLDVLGHTGPLTPARARELGVAHVPEDRLKRGLVRSMRVDENVALGRHRRPPFARGHRVDAAGREARARAVIRANDVRPPDPTLRAGALSGGNQQKLVVGREVDGGPKVLIAVQPTRGLDWLAVEAVREKLLAQAASGSGVLLFSLDLEELIAIADRLVVMVGGKVVASVPRADFDERAIGRVMLGGSL